MNTRTYPGNLEPSEEGTVTSAPDLVSPNPATINVYPNPSSGRVEFVATGISDLEEMRVELFDLNGKLLLETRGRLGNVQEVFNRSFEPLKAGVYLLRVQSESIREEVKLVKI